MASHSVISTVGLVYELFSLIPLALKTSVIASVVAVLFGAFQYALVHQAKENTAVYAVFCNAGEEDRTPAINLGS